MSAPDALALPGLPKDANGPVFAEPWQAQAFALAVQLNERGAFTWTEWAQALSEEIRAAGPSDGGGRYFELWLSALERLVAEKQLAAASALAERKQAWAAAYRRTPHGRPVLLSEV